MSYSRWNGCRWYTYWDAYSGPAKEDKLFTICRVTSFTYKELKDDIDSCLKKAKEIEKKDTDQFITKEDMVILRECMEAFLLDVEREFSA